jgi:MFS family permease
MTPNDSTGPAALRGIETQTLSADDAKTITYRYERLRAVASGMLETAGTTFLLLIVVSHFNATANQKALIAAGGSFGMLLTPVIVFVVASMGWRVAKAASLMSFVGAAGFLVAAFSSNIWVFIVGCLLAMLSTSSAIPLMTQVYQENYPADQRGQLFSKAIFIRIATAIVFSYLAGKLLNLSMDHYHWLILIFCACLLISGFCQNRCPSRPLNNAGHTHPFKGLHYVVDDALFRNTLISWMLMGFANLMMVMLRVEYLANEKYGPPLDPAKIALLIGVIPNIARLALSPVWGRLFDRMNFFWMRFLLNMGFAIGALAFFAGRDMWSMTLGAIVFGISNAGGDVAWSLWVTKLAPPDRVAEYMSVHTFTTGLRGVLAPVVGFHLLTMMSFDSISYIGAAMIFAASLLLLPEMLSSRNKTARTPPPPPMPEEAVD